MAETAKILGVPAPTPGNWVRLVAKNKLKGAGIEPVSTQLMERAQASLSVELPDAAGFPA